VSDLESAIRSVASAGRLLAALDFDGVLAPIVDVPSDARPLPESAAALGALATLPDTTVALVSGRGLADLAAVSGFGSPIRMIGSHGGEFDDGAAVLDDDQRERLDRLDAELRRLVGGRPGVVLEHKPAGIAVHVRNAPPEVGARVLEEVQAGPAAWDGVEATPGKAVLDLSVMDIDKGVALDTLRERVEADAVFFAGDDVTDETAFARLRPGDLGVKVGPGETLAEYRVDAPADVAGLLERLLAARTGR
jgi:trehalose 6-phosphate phosphatase